MSVKAGWVTNCVVLSVIATQASSMAAEDGSREFAAWASSHLSRLSTLRPEPPHDDLEPLGRMIGDATVVALSEATHCSAEPLEFRNRLLRYLVEKKGFTAVALESGIVEGRVLHEYVRGADGEISTALARGLSWTFDLLPQNRELVEWLRTYNADPKHRQKINFYGFDMPGSPTNPSANRNHETALTEALNYLSRVDRAAAAQLHARVDRFMGRLAFNWQGIGNSTGYLTLSLVERDSLTAAIGDLVSLLERKEAAFISSSSANDYAWGYRAAIGARQLDNFLRNVPQDWQPLTQFEHAPIEQLRVLTETGNVRDRAQADNLSWIIRQEGAAGKVLVFAHLSHLTNTPSVWKTTAGDLNHYVCGTYLKRWFANQLVTIGNLIGEGVAKCGKHSERIARSQPGSTEFILAELAAPRFFLDLRAAPPPVKAWLAREHPPGRGKLEFDVAPSRSFDVLLYFDELSGAD